MANTSTKVNRFIALGYSFFAGDTSIESSGQSSSSVKIEIIHADIEKENNILPINNQVLQTINIQKSSGSLKI